MKAKELERYFKGVSNHRRIEILRLLAKEDGLTLWQISVTLDCNFKTVAGHTRILAQTGLITKKYYGQEVQHSLSLYGKKFISFMKAF